MLQLGNDSWYVICAASCHMALVFVVINWMEWSTIPVCPSLMRSFNRANTEGTNSSKKLFDVWVCT